MSKSIFGVLRSFAKDEKGVVTVEWVALAGAVVIGAIAVGWIVLNNLKAPASTIGTNITSCESLAASQNGSVTGCQ
jgi:Flp pilus assembly pilin Flp